MDEDKMKQGLLEVIGYYYKQKKLLHYKIEELECQNKFLEESIKIKLQLHAAQQNENIKKMETLRKMR